MSKKLLVVLIICILLVTFVVQTAFAIPTPDEWWVQLILINKARAVSTSQNGMADYISAQADLRDSNNVILESAFAQDWDYFEVRATTAGDSDRDNAKGYHRWVIDSSSYYEITYDN